MVLGGLTKSDVEGCYSTVENRVGHNDTFTWSLEWWVVSHNEEAIGGDNNILKIAFDINNFSSLL